MGSSTITPMISILFTFLLFALHPLCSQTAQSPTCPASPPELTNLAIGQPCDPAPEAAPLEHGFVPAATNLLTSHPYGLDFLQQLANALNLDATSLSGDEPVIYVNLSTLDTWSSLRVISARTELRIWHRTILPCQNPVKYCDPATKRVTTAYLRAEYMLAPDPPANLGALLSQRGVASPWSLDGLFPGIAVIPVPRHSFGQPCNCNPATRDQSCGRLTPVALVTVAELLSQPRLFLPGTTDLEVLFTDTSGLATFDPVYAPAYERWRELFGTEAWNAPLLFSDRNRLHVGDPWCFSRETAQVVHDLIFGARTSERGNVRNLWEEFWETLPERQSVNVRTSPRPAGAKTQAAQ